jgi:hypothetical protein
MAQQIPNGTRFIGIATSVDLVERKSAVLNKQTEPYTIEDIVLSVPAGPAGPQGVQGPAGPLGPVGPAGLTWRGAWVSGTSYVANNAVGYNGATWFCILATSGTTTPNSDSTHWALLASQGAQGAQGVQGPAGAQGPAGNPATQTLDQTLTLGNSSLLGAKVGELYLYDTTELEYGKIKLEDSEFRFHNNLGNQIASLSGGGVTFSSILGYTAQLLATTITDSRQYQLPNASGTIALLSDIPSGTVPTLQQVVDAGNTVTDGSGFTFISPGGLSVSYDSSIANLYPYSLDFRNSDNGNTVSLSPPYPITSNIIINLPNVGGTLALQSYRVWRAKINSSSVVTVYSNEIGFTSPVITNPFNGKILITKTGFFSGFAANKVDLITSTVNNSGTPFVCTLERYNLALNNSIILNVFDMAGGQTGTPGCDFIVEIRIYN